MTGETSGLMVENWGSEKSTEIAFKLPTLDRVAHFLENVGAASTKAT